MKIKLNSTDYSVKIDGKELIKNLFDFNIGTAITEIAGIKQGVEFKAFSLLFNASRRTNLQLSKAYGQEQLDGEFNLVNFSQGIENRYKSFLENEVVLTEEFFTNIIAHDNHYLVVSFELFQEYCTGLNIDLPKDIRIDYYINFRENLKEEYQKNKELYEELEAFFNNPITKQNDKIGKLLIKYSELKGFFTNPLQQGSENRETLKDLYIEPFFSVYKNNVINIDEKNDPNFYSLHDNPTVIEFFKKYFFKGKTHTSIKDQYDMVFILGQPGQGKTSFCYKLVYDYVEQNNDLPQVPIIFQKIRELVARDFINSPFETIGKLHSYMNFDEDEFILVLDGLDEAYMSGGITDNDLRNLYDRLKKRSNKNIKIILTSRFNFLDIDDACLDNTLVLQLNEMTDDQIKNYCKNFKKFYPENKLANSIDEIVDSESYGHIKELLRQAVLIYFIAISDIAIEDRDSKAKIYDKIFDSLAQRSWDANGQLDYIKPDLKAKPERYKLYLREYIRSIAFEIFHSPNLFITLNKLLELDSTKLFINRCFTDDIQKSQEKLKDLSKYLLISFYFQQSKKDNSDAALEFFHNSLWEYLTAEYIWEKFKKLVLKKDEYEEFEIVNKVDYFNFLDYHTGNKRLDDYTITKNLIEIIEGESDEIKASMFNQTIKPFLEISKRDFLLKYDFEECSIPPFTKATEIFSLAWILLHESNNGNQKIEIDTNTLDFLFGKSYLEYNNVLDNVEIDDDFRGLEKRFIDELYIANSVMKNIYDYNIHSSNFKNVVFHSFHSFNNIRNTKFEDVIFKNGFIVEGNNIIGNNFQNVSFNEVRIPNKDWYTNFLESNIFDDNFAKDHLIEIRQEEDYNGKDITNHYLISKVVIATT